MTERGTMTTGRALMVVLAFNAFGAYVLLAAGLTKPPTGDPIAELVLNWLRNPVVVASSIGGFAGALIGTWGAMKTTRPPSWLDVPKTGADVLMHLVVNWTVTVFLWPILLPLMTTNPVFEVTVGTAFLVGVLAQNLLLRVIAKALRKADEYEPLKIDKE